MLLRLFKTYFNIYLALKIPGSEQNIPKNWLFFFLEQLEHCSKEITGLPFYSVPPKKGLIVNAKTILLTILKIIVTDPVFPEWP